MAAAAGGLPTEAQAQAQVQTQAQTQSARGTPAPVSPAALQRGAVLDLGSTLPGLTREPVRLVSAGRPLAEVQRHLEPTLGVRLILSGGAADITVSGEFTGEDGLSFVRALAAKLRLDWAVGREGIYLAPEGSARSVVFNAPTPTIAFRAAALANQEFEELGSSIRVVGRKEEITVTGIPAWINQVAALRIPALVDFVQRTMAQFAASKEAAAEQARWDAASNLPGAGNSAQGEPLSLMVFRLNNAYVDDKRLAVGSNAVLIPGVASLFRQFTGLGGGDVATQTGVLDTGTTRMGRIEPLAGGRSGRQDRLDRFDRLEREDDPGRAPRPPAQALANQPAVIADSRMNALIVRDRASMLAPYKALVEVLDQSTDMVQLDAFVIDIKASKLDEFGFGLSWAGSSRVNSPGFSPGGTVPAGANVILQAVRGAQLLAQIRALETNGDSEILTVPSVVTLNNLEATFSARQNFYVKVSGNQDASLTKVTAETLLKVTPLVSNAAGSSGNDRRIRLLISIQDGSVDSSSSSVVDNLPRTLENQISTQAVVRGGDTLVIGGQVVRKSIKRIAGLPIIRDIPLLGALTSSRSDEFEQYVRVYVVRPRLLGDDSTALSAPVAPERADPLVNGVIDRVPGLIRGSGLSPRGLDAQRPPGPAGPGAEPVVVPVPQPVPPPERSAPAKPGGPATPDTGTDWNPDDPAWRPPGGPLGGPGGPGGAPAGRPAAAVTVTSGRAGAGTNAAAPLRVDAPTQIARDQEMRRILETELQRTEQTTVRLVRDAAQGVEGAGAALARARADGESLRKELARLQPPLAAAPAVR
jgi:type III secretion protein C